MSALWMNAGMAIGYVLAIPFVLIGAAIGLFVFYNLIDCLWQMRYMNGLQPRIGSPVVGSLLVLTFSVTGIVLGFDHTRALRSQRRSSFPDRLFI